MFGDGYSRVNFVAGLFLGLVVILYVALLIVGLTGHYEWVEKWQTLAAGTLGTIATLATAFILVAQIRQTERSLLSERSRKILLARARLISPVANLLSFQSETVRALRELLSKSPSKAAVDELENLFFRSRRFSDEDRFVLQDCIEFTEGLTCENLSRIVALLQIQRARLDCLLRKPTGSNSAAFGGLPEGFLLEVHVVDALEIHARATLLILYARKSSPPHEIQTLEQAFRNSVTAHKLLDTKGELGNAINSRAEDLRGD
jgi:hypothetical protein